MVPTLLRPLSSNFSLGGTDYFKHAMIAQNVRRNFVDETGTCLGVWFPAVTFPKVRNFSHNLSVMKAYSLESTAPQKMSNNYSSS